MADVTLLISGQSYTVSCRDGEEDRLRTLGALVAAKTSEAKAAVGDNLSEARMLLFAALLLADELDELRDGDGQAAAGIDAETLEALALRAEALGEALAPESRAP